MFLTNKINNNYAYHGGKMMEKLFDTEQTMNYQYRYLTH